MKLVLSVFCVFFASLVYRKGYNIWTVLEYLFLAATCLSEINISFSAFQTVKVFTSLLLFAAEIYWQKEEFRNKKVLTTWRNPFHAMLAVGSKTYHYSLPRETTSEERSFDVVPSVASKPTYQLRTKMFYAPCVGFAIDFSEDAILERLKQCGKCQDWAAVAAYVLSCHKFLSYSCFIYLRWFTWIVFGVLSLLEVIAWLVVYRYITSDMSAALKVYEVKLVKLAAHTALNCGHMLLVAFDILNMRTERLEDNDSAVKKHFNFRGVWYDTLKLAVLTSLAFAWHAFIPPVVTEYDFFVYVLVCVITGQIVHWTVSILGRSIENNVSGRHEQASVSKKKKRSSHRHK